MRRLFVVPLLALLVVGVTACEESKGGFGEGKVKDTSGMVRKPGEAPTKAPNFKDAFTLSSSFDKASSTVKVQMNLQPGFHAYAAGEKIGKPVSLDVNGNGWAVDGAVSVPAGKQKDLGELGISMILEGQVPISAKVKGGTGDVTGTLNVQVCTDTACDRPRPHAIKVPTT